VSPDAFAAYSVELRLLNQSRGQRQNNVISFGLQAVSGAVTAHGHVATIGSVPTWRSVLMNQNAGSSPISSMVNILTCQ
jgi:hypothetical protein